MMSDRRGPDKCPSVLTLPCKQERSIFHLGSKCGTLDGVGGSGQCSGQLGLKDDQYLRVFFSVLGSGDLKTPGKG